MKRLFLLMISVVIIISSCHFNETGEVEKIPVKEIKFKQGNLTVEKGETKHVDLQVYPDNVTDKTVKYRTASGNDSVFKISEGSYSGCLITGVSRGKDVLMAESGDVTAYMEINITEKAEEIKYITIPFPTKELAINDKSIFTVTINTDDPNDKYGFEYEVEKTDIIDVIQNENTFIVTGKEGGISHLTITHSKAQSTNILFLVGEAATSVKYLTTESDVIKTTNLSSASHLRVDVVNGNYEDYENIKFEIKNGKDIIEIEKNQNICSITPKNPGNAIIEITNNGCPKPLYVQVIVKEAIENAYIYVENTMIEMNVSTGKNVEAIIIGTENNYTDNFYYEVSDEQIIEVTQYQNAFYIYGLKEGQAKLTIGNDNVATQREILILVEEIPVSEYENYLTTTQNVISMEKGQLKELLDVYMVGGTEADRNGFEWNVDNEEIIELITSDGKVNYNGSRNVNESRVNGKCYIDAKECGVAHIEITHEKSKVPLEVTVKVYPAGTFNERAILKGPGIIQLNEGEYKNIDLTCVNEPGKTVWSIKNSEVATITSENPLNAVINGKQRGVTELTVSAEYSEGEYNAVVSVGENNVIYIDNSMITIERGKISYIEIKKEGNVDISKYEAVTEDEGIVTVRASGNILIVEGLDEGSTGITIYNETADNEIRVEAIVEEKTTLDKPYLLRAPSFLAIEKGKTETLTATLSGGAGKKDNEKTVFKYNDNGKAVIEVNKNDLTVTGLQTGKFDVDIENTKAKNSIKTSVYIVPEGTDVSRLLLMRCSKTDYLAELNEKLCLSLEVNNEELADTIQWSCSDMTMAEITGEGKRAYLSFTDTGLFTITAESSLSPEKIEFVISVTGKRNPGKYIDYPGIIEMIQGENRLISGVFENMTEQQIEQTVYQNKSEEIITITGKGEYCYVKALKPGIGYIRISNTQAGYEKDITVSVVEEEEQLGKAILLSTEKSYYRIKKGEFIELEAVFGTAGYPEEKLNEIEWVSTSSSIKINGQGKKVTVEGLSTGIAEISINSEAANACTVKVEVYEDTYASSAYFDCDSIITMVKGRTENINYVIRDGNTVINRYDNVIIEKDNENLSIINGDGVLRITAGEAGNTYITLRATNVREKKILVCIAETQAELEKLFPLSIQNDSYVIDVNEEIMIVIDTISSEEEQLNQIKWQLNTTNYISTKFTDKKTVKITGKKEGTTLITVKHPGSSDLNITVTVRDSSKEGPYIKSESIIKMLTGTTYETELTTNINSPDEIKWTTENENIASVSGNGKKGLIEAKEKGNAYVKATYEDIEKKILVAVRNTEAELDSLAVMTLPRDTYIVKKAETFMIKPVFSTIVDESKTEYDIIEGQNLISMENRNGTAVINAEKEGIVTIKVTNNCCENYILFKLEITEKVNGNVTVPEAICYLTANKTAYVLDPDKKTEGITINISAVGVPEAEYSLMSWKADDSCISLYPNGTKCEVYPNREGKSTITVYHPLCDNTLKFEINVIKENVENIKPVYITSKTDVVTVKDNENFTVEVEIKNLTEYDNSKFTWSVKDPDIVKVTESGNKAVIKGSRKGTTMVTVSHENGSTPFTFIVISDVTTDDNVYLTTKDNYSIIAVGDTKTLEITLKGLEDLIASNYIWETETPDIIKIKGNGKYVQVEGLKEGEGIIKVTHKDAPYPLNLYVKVSSKALLNPVYIKPENNSTVINIVEGETYYYKFTLQNGKEYENSLFNYENQTQGIIQTVGNGNTCVIKALKAGLGIFNVTHPSSIEGNLQIKVIVDEKPASDSLYITCDTPLIEMKPGETGKNIQVRLVGGKPEDIYGFNFNILSYESYEKFQDGTSKSVIKMVSSADTAILTAENEGTAVIRITHAKTNSRLDIKIIVTEYTELKLGSSNVTVTAGESITIPVEVPGNETVVYESSDYDIASVTGTNKLCIIEGLSEGTCVVTAHTPSGGASDQVIVKVNKNNSSDYKYIYSTTNLLTLVYGRTNATVNAELKGNGTITEAMQNQLKWSTASGGDSIIKIYGSGKTVQITPVGIGETNLYCKYGSIVKRIPVIVEADEVFFTVSDTYREMMIGDSVTVNAQLTNTTDSEYKNISWSIEDNSIAGLSITTGKTVKITAKKTGETYVNVTYGSKIKQIFISVIEKKSLSFTGNSKIVMSSLDTVRVKVNCTPAKDYDNLTVAASTNLYVDVNFDSVNKELVITSKNTPGSTIITLAVGNLKTNLQVDVSTDTYFTMRQNYLRELPTGSYRLPYSLFPDTGTFRYDITTGGNISEFCTITDDRKNHEFVITPKKSFIQNVRITNSELKQEVTVNLAFLYENVTPDVQLSFKRITADGKTVKSRIDQVNRIIYLADGEKLTVMMQPPTSLPNATMIPLKIEPDTKLEGNSKVVKTSEMETAAEKAANKMKRCFTYASAGKTDTNEALISTSFGGKIILEYNIYKGNSLTTVTEEYTVYLETWFRK